MIDQSNQELWDLMSFHRKELNILYYRMGQLSVESQINILKYAFSIDDEANVWKYLLKSEPIESKNVPRDLTKGLFQVILETRLYPGNYELDAQLLLNALIRDFPDYVKNIHSSYEKYLDEADKDSDYEVYQRACDLLIDIKSDHLDEFLKRCREHESPDIREIDEDWDD